MKLLMDIFTRKVNDNANSVRFLASMLDRISVSMERNLSKYQETLAGLDSLKRKFIEHFKEYELTMTEALNS